MGIGAQVSVKLLILSIVQKNLVTLSLTLKLVVTISQGLKANFGNQARKHFCQKRPLSSHTYRKLLGLEELRNL